MPINKKPNIDTSFPFIHFLFLTVALFEYNFNSTFELYSILKNNIAIEFDQITIRRTDQQLIGEYKIHCDNDTSRDTQGQSLYVEKYTLHIFVYNTYRVVRFPFQYLMSIYVSITVCMYLFIIIIRPASHIHFKKTPFDCFFSNGEMKYTPNLKLETVHRTTITCQSPREYGLHLCILK